MTSTDRGAIGPSALAARRRVDIGLALEREGDPAGAAACYAAAVEADPDWPEARFLLAGAEAAAGRRESAIAGYRAYLAAVPEDTLGAAARLALLGAAAPERLPVEHVRRLFDAYAHRFDADLVDGLGYRAPQVLRALWESLPDRPARPVTGLDLGCGTGLGGAAFADCAEALDGIDLSSAMLARARARGLYRRLERGDLTVPPAPAPDAPAWRYDLVLAADALPYLGDLSPALRAAAAALVPRGHLLASLEDGGEAPGWSLGPGQRYRHALGYVAEASAAAGFEVAAVERVPLRREGGAAVAGLFVALRRLPSREAADETAQPAARQARRASTAGRYRVR
ncbi:MAG: methyltransferase domain-containing protein [Azospirillaceae bacterium]